MLREDEDEDEEDEDEDEGEIWFLLPLLDLDCGWDFIPRNRILLFSGIINSPVEADLPVPVVPLGEFSSSSSSDRDDVAGEEQGEEGSENEEDLRLLKEISGEEGGEPESELASRLVIEGGKDGKDGNSGTFWDWRRSDSLQADIKIEEIKGAVCLPMGDGHLATVVSLRLLLTDVKLQEWLQMSLLLLLEWQLPVFEAVEWSMRCEIEKADEPEGVPVLEWDDDELIVENVVLVDGAVNLVGKPRGNVVVDGIIKVVELPNLGNMGIEGVKLLPVELKVNDAGSDDEDVVINGLETCWVTILRRHRY